MKVVKNKQPYKYLHIDNNYLLVNNQNDDYILNIYYLSSTKFQVIIRKINNISGWKHNISIKIYEDDKMEMFNIGSSLKNYKKVNLFCSTIKLIEKKNKILKIPKVIIQTNKNRYFEDELAYNSILSFLDFNPNYEYRFFDNVECREFIKEHFNKFYLYYYDLIYPGAFKADFFRYCYLYINGGFYFDSKSILLVSLDNIINEDDYLILCQDNHKLGLYNAIIMTEPKQVLFLNLINKIIYKIKNFSNIFFPKMPFKQYIKLDNILSLSGPNLLYEEFNVLNLNYKKHVLMKHDILGNYKNYKNLVVNFKNKLILYKNYNNFNIHNPNHYSVLWKKHDLFYKNHVENSEYSFLVKPNKLNILLHFYIIHNKILIVSNININTPIEFIVIDNNSEVFDKRIPMIKNNYIIIDHDFSDFQSIIKSISSKENKIDISKFEFTINKINNNFYFIVYNPYNLSLNDIEIEINFEDNIINYNFTTTEKKIYYIENINYLFNIKN